MRKYCLLVLLSGAVSFHSPAQTTEKRPLRLSDMALLREVEELNFSPDGEWVAYTVRSTDTLADKRTSDIWMTSWDGSQTLRLTHSKDNETNPRFSPDGRYLSFLSSRGDEEEATAQLWLLNRAGGEAERITQSKGGVSDYEWSPDSKYLALIARDADPDSLSKTDKAKKKTPKPIVIDRFQFKQDVDGYLNEQRQHLYLFDVATQRTDVLTPGKYDEHLPSWSPDSRTLAFVSKRGPEPDRHDNYDIYLIEAKPGAIARQLTTAEAADADPGFGSRPAWSPDGKQIAYVQGGPKELIWYAVHRLATIPAGGGSPRLLDSGLDRNMTKPAWAPDGKSVYFLLEDDRAVVLAQVPATGGKVERILDGPREVGEFDISRNGRMAVLNSQLDQPAEVFAFEKKNLRPLSQQNQWLNKIKLGTVEAISGNSKDGTKVSGFLVKPPDYQKGRRYPTLLRIHGGPVAQYSYDFSFEWQFLAANGYVVVAANPRGSSGRGEEYCKAIFADWGNKDAQDVLSVVDYAVAQGIADPNKLGVGGWSYGGILTNYVIAQDKRFKTAVSGASISNVIAGYGTDQYIREYEAELGTPWTKPEVWSRLSFPFLHADRITTPTLFLCGEKDFNVPLLNSEQMYQALKSLGVDTRLVIYPGQFHGITKPSYLMDRLERYLDWYGKYLMPKTAASAAGSR